MNLEKHSLASLELPETPEAFLEWVDFDELDAIFSHIQKKSGVTNLRSINKQNIRIIPDEKRFSGVYNPHANETTISNYEPENATPAYVTLRRLETLVHELIHGLVYKDVRTIGKHKIAQKVGLRIIPDLAFPLWIDEMIDEALTQKIAHEIVTEYLRRKGLTKIAADAEKVRPYNHPITELNRLTSAEEDDYIPEQFRFEQLLKLLGKVLDTNSEEVYRAFVRLSFSGEDSFLQLKSELSSMLNAYDSRAVREAFERVEMPRQLPNEEASTSWGLDPIAEELIQSIDARKLKTLLGLNT